MMGKGRFRDIQMPLNIADRHTFRSSFDEQPKGFEVMRLPSSDRHFEAVSASMSKRWALELDLSTIILDLSKYYNLALS